MKIKVGINSRIYQEKSSGIQQYIENLYKHCIALEGNKNFLFLQTKDNKKIGITKKLEVMNGLLGSVLFDNFLVNKLIKKEKIDVFHGPAGILPFFKIKGIKYVLTIHDLSFLIFSKNHSKLFNFYYKYFTKRSLKNADIIVADSDNTKKDIIKYYKIPEKKIETIYLGIDSDFLNSPKNLKNKDKYFFSVTTHPVRKNIIGVIKAMAHNKNLKDYKYLIAGLISEDNKLELEKEIKRNNLEDKVRLVGYVSKKELITLYTNASFFVFPSFYEGFGFPVLEAMACGCPVITSNNSSLIEVTPNKTWLVDPYDISDISNKMDLMVKLSEEARQLLIKDNLKFVRKFSWDNTAQAIIQIFNKLQSVERKDTPK